MPLGTRRERVTPVHPTSPMRAFTTPGSAAPGGRGDTTDMRRAGLEMAIRYPTSSATKAAVLDAQGTCTWIFQLTIRWKRVDLTQHRGKQKYDGAR